MPMFCVLFEWTTTKMFSCELLLLVEKLSNQFELSWYVLALPPELITAFAASIAPWQPFFPATVMLHVLYALALTTPVQLAGPQSLLNTPVARGSSTRARTTRATSQWPG